MSRSQSAMRSLVEADEASMTTQTPVTSLYSSVRTSIPTSMRTHITTAPVDDRPSRWRHVATIENQYSWQFFCDRQKQIESLDASSASASAWFVVGTYERILTERANYTRRVSSRLVLWATRLPACSVATAWRTQRPGTPMSVTCHHLACHHPEFHRDTSKCAE